MPRQRGYISDSDDSYDDSSIEQQAQLRKPKIQRIDKFKTLKKIVINVSMTQYPVVSEVAEQLGWKIQTSNDAGDWDVYWTDFSIDPDVLIRMHLFQKINHYPGIQCLARKNLLASNLASMSRKYESEYDFYPLTWRLPEQFSELREYFETKKKGKARTYIVKPEADCQGRGIFLTRKLEDMQNGKHYVVQRYLARPYLLDGLKFDLRIYILLAGTDPLRLYMYKEGLARLATELYHEPLNANLDRLCMHLTNYAINKHSPKFVFNNNTNNMGIGHKRSLTCAYKQLQKSGLNIPELKQKIKDMLIKTVISGLPLMSHQYRCSQPEQLSGNMCFHVLGFDVMLNNKGQPMIIQVNHTPSFTTDTPLDHKIKYNLIKDTLVLMNVNVKKKNQLLNKCKEYNTERLLTGKRHIYEGEDRAQRISEAQALREEYEIKHYGGYEKIYPVDDVEKSSKYEEMIKTSMDLYLGDNQAVRRKHEGRQLKRMMKEEAKNLKVNQKPPEHQGSLNNKEASNNVGPTSLTGAIDEMESAKDMQSMMPVSEPIIGHSVRNKQTDRQKAYSIQNRLFQGRNIQKVIRTKNTASKGGHSAANKHNNMMSNWGKPQSELGQERADLIAERMRNPIAQRTDPTGDRNSDKNYTKTSNLSKSSHNKQPMQFPIIQKNGCCFSQQFSNSEHSAHLYEKIRSKISHNKFVLKSSPKPFKIDNTERGMTDLKHRRNFVNNGNYIMPKIFSLKIDTESEQMGQRSELTILTMGKKAQSYNQHTQG